MKTSKDSGNRRPADVSDGPTAPELCPPGPSCRSAFTRIQTRVAMHVICVLPCCGADAEGLSATTFDAQISTFICLLTPQGQQALLLGNALDLWFVTFRRHLGGGRSGRDLSPRCRTRCNVPLLGCGGLKFSGLRDGRG